MDPNQQGSKPPIRAEVVQQGQANPFAAPQASTAPVQPTGPTRYSSLPALRKNSNCSAIVLAHLAVMVLGGFIPYGRLLGIPTTIGVIAVCISVLTGDVYYEKRNRDGTLKKWGVANKVAAVILLILLVGGNIALTYIVYRAMIG